MNWLVSRVRVHREDCSFCQHGQGIHPNKFEGENMKWHGPYSSREEAKTIAKGLESKDTDFCKHCK